MSNNLKIGRAPEKKKTVNAHHRHHFFHSLFVFICILEWRQRKRPRTFHPHGVLNSNKLLILVRELFELFFNLLSI